MCTPNGVVICKKCSVECCGFSYFLISIKCFSHVVYENIKECGWNNRTLGDAIDYVGFIRNLTINFSRYGSIMYKVINKVKHITFNAVIIKFNKPWFIEGSFYV